MSRPKLILCADGGGSKVCVVVRSEDGLEVRGQAGPCNVQSIGHIPAADRILEATYRALEQLPATHLPAGFASPPLLPVLPPGVLSRVASPVPSGANTPRSRLAPLKDSLFEFCWIALAGMTTPADATAFLPFVSSVLAVPPEKVSLTNGEFVVVSCCLLWRVVWRCCEPCTDTCPDVNLLAAPALIQSGIDHCVAVVCGTGTIGRAIKLTGRDELPPSPPVHAELDGSDESPRQTSAPKTIGLEKGLPLEDVGVARGWGFMLCDEGSAFWIGRLAIRYLLSVWDRDHSPHIYSSPPPEHTPLYDDLLEYFAVEDPTELIGIVSLMTDFTDDLSTGEAQAKRNAYMAGAARVVFKWAFPAENSTDIISDAAQAAHGAALQIAKSAIAPVIQLTLETLGDRTIVFPKRTALNLGGGLWNSTGYRTLYLDGLAAENAVFRHVNLVTDAAGESAKALAGVIWGNAY
jgi:N-acetylglucosamine kinase-like BadF-type ATPase